MIIDLRNTDSTCADKGAGIKYHLKSGDDITVNECFQYFVYSKFQIDLGATMTINEGGQLVVHDGILCNDGTLINDGEIINT